MSSIVAQIECLAPAVASPAVLKSTTISLQGGRITCLLGPSGSGKSTLLRLLSGDRGLEFSGSLKYERNGLQHDLRQSTVSGQVGILVPEAVLPPWLTIREVLAMPARLNRLLAPPLTESIQDELVALGLEPSVLEKRPHDLSMGMRHRVLLSFYFLYSPSHVFIDELFSALDPPTAKMAITRLRDRVAKEAATCLLTTHDIELASVYGDAFLYKHGRRPTLEEVGSPGGCRGAKVRESLQRLFDEEYPDMNERKG
jgi:ABC-type multidrug transport system ATPase subunit